MVLKRFLSFMKVFDERFEDLRGEGKLKIIYRDLSAGLIVALTAIPMAMGFAIASGFRPEQGIIAGAVACLVGRTFGGSKYQVYGPTAAFIPLFVAMTSRYDHSFVVLVSVCAGVVLMVLGLFGLGKVARYVPESIVVGFTVGIAVVIATSNLGEALGVNLKEASIFTAGFLSSINFYAFTLAIGTFLICRYLMRISVFIPAPLIAIVLTSVIANQFWTNHGIVLVSDRFGAIPHNFFAFTPPVIPDLTTQVVLDALYFIAAVVFISGVESLLCSSMADKLAGNKGTPFNPDKEFWGQGLVQIITPLLNGFPCTGALARTATSIRAGAVTPLAGYFKGVLKLLLAIFIASYLEHVPMACIAGILLWVATNMVKLPEVKGQWVSGWVARAFLVYTAVMVPATDFLTGVLSALVLYGVVQFVRLRASRRWVEVPVAAVAEKPVVDIRQAE